MQVDLISSDRKKKKKDKTHTGSLKDHPPIDKNTCNPIFSSFKPVVRAHKSESPGVISLIVKSSLIKANAKFTGNDVSMLKDLYMIVELYHA
jgi:hypothetical protein